MKYKLLTADDKEIIHSDPKDLYSYTVYKGDHDINVGVRDSCWYVDLGDNIVGNVSDTIVESKTLAVVIYGYKPWERYSEINDWTTLPYVNGCSTTQLLPPIRSGDPTFQLLRIPPYTSEQLHHIHSTARVVYVLSGRGHSVLGANESMKSEDLLPGSVLVLDKMVPHHFVTGEDPLVVLPLHIFSSVGLDEFNHPMYNGTHKA